MSDNATGFPTTSERRLVLHNIVHRGTSSYFDKAVDLTGGGLTPAAAFILYGWGVSLVSTFFARAGLIGPDEGTQYTYEEAQYLILQIMRIGEANGKSENDALREFEQKYQSFAEYLSDIDIYANHVLDALTDDSKSIRDGVAKFFNESRLFTEQATGKMEWLPREKLELLIMGVAVDTVDETIKAYRAIVEGE